VHDLTGKRSRVALQHQHERFRDGCGGVCRVASDEGAAGARDSVVGLDNMNDYYPLVHKERHLADLTGQPNYTFVHGDLRDAPMLLELFRNINRTRWRTWRRWRRCGTRSSIR